MKYSKDMMKLNDDDTGESFGYGIGIYGQPIMMKPVKPYVAPPERQAFNKLGDISYLKVQEDLKAFYWKAMLFVSLLDFTSDSEIQCKPFIRCEPEQDSLGNWNLKYYYVLLYGVDIKNYEWWNFWNGNLSSCLVITCDVLYPHTQQLNSDQKRVYGHSSISVFGHDRAKRDNSVRVTYTTNGEWPVVMAEHVVRTKELFKVESDFVKQVKAMERYMKENKIEL